MRTTTRLTLKLVLLAALTSVLCFGASSCLSEIVPWPASADAGAHDTLEEPGHRF